MKLVDKIVQREPQPNRKSFGTKGAQKNEMHPRLCTDVLVKIGQNGTYKLMRSRGRLYASSGQALESDSLSNLMKSYK